MNNSEFLALFTSGKIIGQQVLLPIPYDYPIGSRPVNENSALDAVVSALKAGQLPPTSSYQLSSFNKIGAHPVLPKKLIP